MVERNHSGERKHDHGDESNAAHCLGPETVTAPYAAFNRFALSRVGLQFNFY
jgi:hypothetical protein